jgi:hypothetical protein
MEPYLVLPGTKDGLIDEWQIHSGRSERAIARRDSHFVPLAPGRDLTVTAVLGGKNMAETRLRLQRAIPALVFDGSTYKLMTRSEGPTSIRGEDVLILHSTQTSIISPAATNDEFPPLSGKWSQWKISRVSCSGSSVISLRHSGQETIEEQIMERLGLPYRVVDIAIGDLGPSAARKLEITWSKRGIVALAFVVSVQALT